MVEEEKAVFKIIREVVWGLWRLQLRVRWKVWVVCLQVKAKAEAAQRKGVRDNTVKRSAP